MENIEVNWSTLDIKNLLDVKVNSAGHVLFLVCWKGYSKMFNSWERASALICDLDETSLRHKIHKCTFKQKKSLLFTFQQLLADSSHSRQVSVSRKNQKTLLSYFMKHGRSLRRPKPTDSSALQSLSSSIDNRGSWPSSQTSPSPPSLSDSADSAPKPVSPSQTDISVRSALRRRRTASASFNSFQRAKVSRLISPVASLNDTGAMLKTVNVVKDDSPSSSTSVDNQTSPRSPAGPPQASPSALPWGGLEKASPSERTVGEGLDEMRPSELDSKIVLQSLVSFHNPTRFASAPVVHKQTTQPQPSPPESISEGSPYGPVSIIRSDINNLRHLIVRKLDGIWQIWLCTKTRLRNSLNPETLAELISVLKRAASDDSCKAVLLGGASHVFCSGVDLCYLNQTVVSQTTGALSARQRVDSLLHHLREFVRHMLLLAKPKVACVTGPVVGAGLGIITLCDVAYASDKACFYAPFVKLRQCPEMALTYTLRAFVSHAVANDLLLVGRKLTAQEAKEAGLVSQVFFPSTTVNQVMAHLQVLINGSPSAVSVTQRLMAIANFGPFVATSDTSLPTFDSQHNAVLDSFDREAEYLRKFYLSHETLSAIKNFLDDTNELIF